MTPEQKEIKVLKKALLAQNKMLVNMRLGLAKLPEWVFDALDKVKVFYNVSNISDIT